MIAAAAPLVACSLLAPGADEYVNGSSAAGAGGASGSGVGGAAPGGTGGSGGTNLAGGGSGGTAGAAGASAAGGAAGATGGAGGSGGTGGTAACSPGTSDGKPHPVALYVMFDRTSTMVSSGRWDVMVNGVSQFVDSSKAVGVRVGGQFFPSPSGSCSGSGYDQPAVAIAPLPGNATAIKATLASPPQATSEDPMDGMLTGGLSVCKAYSTANSDAQCNLVVISDWTGNEDCGATTAQLQSKLSSALASVPPVGTYVVALQPTDVLQGLAAAGGTQAAIVASTASGVREALLRASTPCYYYFPAASTGGQVSWELDSQPLTKVSSPLGCTASGKLQYFEAANTMVLCPATCANAYAGSLPSVTATVTCN